MNSEVGREIYTYDAIFVVMLYFGLVLLLSKQGYTHDFWLTLHTPFIEYILTTLK